MSAPRAMVRLTSALVQFRAGILSAEGLAVDVELAIGELDKDDATGERQAWVQMYAGALAGPRPSTIGPEAVDVANWASDVADWGMDDWSKKFAEADDEEEEEGKAEG